MSLLVAALLVGCTPASAPDSTKPATLAGSSWTIQSVAGVAAAGDKPATLAFTEDRLSGSSGCNRFSGGYSQAGDRLTISSVASTRMACPGPAMDQEQKLFAILGGDVTTSFRDSDTLVIKGANGGEVVLRRAS